MFKKIFVFFALFLILFSFTSSLFAAISFTPDLSSKKMFTLDDFVLTPEEKEICLNNGYLILDYYWNFNYTVEPNFYHELVALPAVDDVFVYLYNTRTGGKFLELESNIVSSGLKFYSKFCNEDGSVYYSSMKSCDDFFHVADTPDFHTDYVIRCDPRVCIDDGIVSYLDSKYCHISGTVNIYADKEQSSTFFDCDNAIGDKDSRLKVTYEYNEDNSSCHIDATLVGGEFTDRIFYSNYAPAISTGELLSKSIFPRERY